MGDKNSEVTWFIEYWSNNTNWICIIIDELSVFWILWLSMKLELDLLFG